MTQDEPRQAGMLAQTVCGGVCLLCLLCLLSLLLSHAPSAEPGPRRVCGDDEAARHPVSVIGWELRQLCSTFATAAAVAGDRPVASDEGITRALLCPAVSCRSSLLSANPKSPPLLP